MKISSRSTLSPARAAYSREPPPLPPISLSTSLSRRLSNSRSIKGGASPAMFPVAGKKRGCGFDNPEPSSPKVTCIGQVRVKSKKKHAKTVRSLSRRRSSGDVNFRKLEHSRSQNQGNQHLKCLQGQRNCSNNNNNNQRWVHIPLTICEALRAFGSEVSCLFPCRSSCSSTMENEEKMGMEVEDGGKHGSCGAVIARWLVALQDGDGGDRRCVDGGGGGEMVAEDDDDGSDVGNVRRHVFDNLEIVNDVILGSKDEARVSICVPPKNALLLMRCRSDSMKMEALTNRFWEPTMNINEETDEDEEFVDFEDKMEENNIYQEDLQLKDEHEHEHEESVIYENKVERDAIPQEEQDHIQKHETYEETNSEIEMKEGDEEEKQEMQAKQSIREEDDDKEQGTETNEEKEEDESFFLESLFEENAVHFQEEEEDSDMEDAQDELFEDEDVQETATRESNIEKIQHSEPENEEISSAFEESTEIHAEYEEIEAENAEISTEIEQNTEFEETKAENAEILTEIEAENEEIEVENEDIEVKDKSIESLPECLLLMMYEPKLSMEVSKETWVCSSDFIRRHSSRKQPPPPPPEPPVQPIDCQPARSSCSFPAPCSMIGVLEQNMGLEPLVLTRCKSEPMRRAVASEACYWTNKLEPPRRASFEVGLAG